MNRLKQYPAAALPLAAFLLLSPLNAEENETPPPAAKKGSDGKPLRDPTQLSPRMREMLAPKKEAQQAEVHRAAPPKLPQIVLRGLVAGSDGDGSAAIEIKNAQASAEGKGAVFLVRAGMIVQAVVDNQTLTLSVKSIGKDMITIEVVELQQTLTIR